MSLKNVVEDLNHISFLLSGRGFTRAHTLCTKALQVLSQTPHSQQRSDDYTRTLQALIRVVDELRKCASTSQPGTPNACAGLAKDVYRYSLLLQLLATSGLKRLIRARRAAYASIALGLPTASLFGFPPIAVALVFLGVLWTYFYFARLKLVGWFTLVSTLMVLLPFVVNALTYFTHAITSHEEISSVASELGISYASALALLAALLAISSLSLALSLYALLVLFRYYRLFG